MTGRRPLLFAFKTISALISLCFFFQTAVYGATPPAGGDLDSISKRIGENLATEDDMNTLAALSQKEPGNDRAHYMLGLYLEAKGYEQLALEAFTRAAALNGPTSPLAHYNRCLLLFRSGETEDAMKEVAQCERLFAKDAEKLFELGLTLDRNRKKTEAKRFFELATRAGHRGAGYGANLAQIRMYQGQLDEALEVVEWDLKSNPADARANQVKAEVLLRSGREDDAMKCYLLAARGSPCKHAAASVATKQFLKRKRYGEALETALLDLLCPPIDEKSMADSKAIVMDLMSRLPDKETRKIVESISANVQKSRRCRYFRLALGDVYDRLRRPYSAMEQYQLAIHDCSAPMSDDSLARGLFRLGLDYELALRNYREAFDLYRRARAQAPDDPEIARNYSRLARRLPHRNKDIAWQIKDAWYSFWKAVLPARQK